MTSRDDFVYHDNFVYHLGEFNGSDMLELQSCDYPEQDKFHDPRSIYVEDTAFYWYLSGLFRAIVKDFDMFESTFVSKKQWHQITQLDVPALLDVDECKIDLIQKTLAEIDHWVDANVSDNGSFLVIGV